MFSMVSISGRKYLSEIWTLLILTLIQRYKVLWSIPYYPSMILIFVLLCLLQLIFRAELWHLQMHLEIGLKSVWMVDARVALTQQAWETDSSPFFPEVVMCWSLWGRTGIIC